MEKIMTVDPVTTLLSGLNVTDEEPYTRKSYSATSVDSHANMIKLRVETFFRELTDLIIIDNVYRGISSCLA